MYLGPIDGHDLKTLRVYLERVKALDGPVLLHILTNKGHGFEPAVKDPVKFHAPAPFQKTCNGVVPLKTSSSRAYTDAVSDTLFEACRRDPKVAVITAAMCEGNKLQKIRDTFPVAVFRRRHLREPRRGLCRGHGQGRCPAGRRHLQHVSSAIVRPDLPGSRPSRSARRLLHRPRRPGRCRWSRLTMAHTTWLTCESSPTWSSWRRPTKKTWPRCSSFALGSTSPVALRYPRANLETIDRDVQPVELGQAEILEWETDGMLLACGSMVGSCLRAAARLHERHGLRVGVVNARFVKPLDRVTIGKAIEECGFVLTVEEGCLMGGFGSAVLEAANEAGLPTHHLRRLGLPDRYVMHAERDEQLAEVGLDVEGITRAALDLAMRHRLDLPRAGGRHQRKGGRQASSSTPGPERGILAGNEPFRAR